MMAKLAALVLALTIAFSFASTAYADQYVHGYYRSNGTYVNGYYRSSPDGNPYNNYSFPGNTNPYTGVTAGGSASSYLNNYYRGSSYSYTPSYAPSYSAPSYSYTSTCPANSYASGSSCKCNYGYVVQNGSCASGYTYCDAQIGVMSTYNSLTNSCECFAGYALNTMGICTYKNTSAYSGYTSGYTGATSYSCPLHSTQSATSSSCYCDAGYKPKGSGCVAETKKDKDDACHDSFGSKSQWDGDAVHDNGAYGCSCKSGYAFLGSGDDKRCVRD